MQILTDSEQRQAKVQSAKYILNMYLSYSHNVRLIYLSIELCTVSEICIYSKHRNYPFHMCS